MRQYYIGDEKPRTPVITNFTVRPGTLIKYKPVADRYRTLPLFKQFYKIMEEVKYNDAYITEAEVISILRRLLSTKPPSKSELKHVSNLVHHFRKWLGPLNVLVAYKLKLSVQNKIQWVYQPLDKKQYNKLATSKNMVKIAQGILDMHQNNLTTLNLPKREIDKRLKEISDQLDIEADLHLKSRSKKRRRSKP
jgi:hypothetical protein